MISRVIVQPPVEPLTLQEAKDHCVVTHDQHDSMLMALIVAARKHVEEHYQISLVTQTREVAFDRFQDDLLLTHGPVQSVEAVEYMNADGTLTPLTEADYQVDLYGAPVRVSAAYSAYWPTARVMYRSVRVRYVAGFEPVDGSPTDYAGNIPEDIKVALKLLVGNWYDNREASITGTINTALEFGVTALLSPYRQRLGMA
jgi:uncharacterized phiE125 gp8 family phage protein